MTIRMTFVSSHPPSVEYDITPLIFRSNTSDENLPGVAGTCHPHRLKKSFTARSALTGPRKVRADGVEVEPPLPDQIAAARYLDGKTATAKRGLLGVRFQELVPPGGG